MKKFLAVFEKKIYLKQFVMRYVEIHFVSNFCLRTVNLLVKIHVDHPLKIKFYFRTRSLFPTYNNVGFTRNMYLPLT